MFLIQIYYYENMMKKSNFLLLVLFSLFTITLNAQDIDFSGWGAGGYKFFARNQLNGYNQESYYAGKIQFDFEYNKKIEAQLDLRGNSVDKSIVLREFSTKFKYLKKFRIKFGNTKRPFGYQYIELNREELMTIERSIPVQRQKELGFGGRSFSLMGYYKYSAKRPEFPYSYYLSLFADNSLNQGFSGRFGYHFGSSAIAANLLYQNRGGDEPISTTGYGIDYSFESKDMRGLFEISYTGNPTLGVIYRLGNKDEKVNSLGATLGGSYFFNLDHEVVKKLEPVLLFSYYSKDASNSDDHIIQSVIGLNIYFHKNVLARINGDIRLTKNEFNENYTTNESRGIFELLVRF